MALFNLFTRKPENSKFSMQVPSEADAEMEVSQETEIKNVPESNSTSSKTLTVSYATGWPIDLIYGYLHKNYEEKGYADAMLNSNLTFRDMNMAIIRNKMLMVFREINLKYDAISRDIQTRINTCNAVGLLTSVAELEKQMAIINSHRGELSQLELDFRNNANEASVPLMSYECGFLRGVSAIAMSASTQAQPQTSIQIPVSPFISVNRETA